MMSVAEHPQFKVGALKDNIEADTDQKEIEYDENIYRDCRIETHDQANDDEEKDHESVSIHPHIDGDAILRHPICSISIMAHVRHDLAILPQIQRPKYAEKLQTRGIERIYLHTGIHQKEIKDASKLIHLHTDIISAQNDPELTEKLLSMLPIPSFEDFAQCPDVLDALLNWWKTRQLMSTADRC